MLRKRALFIVIIVRIGLFLGRTLAKRMNLKGEERNSQGSFFKRGQECQLCRDGEREVGRRPITQIQEM